MPTSHHRATRRLVALVVVATLLLAAAITPAAAGGSGRSRRPAPATFGVQPAFLPDVSPRSFFSWVATPGGHVSDTAAVLNFSTAPLTLQLRVTDAVNTESGGFALVSETTRNTDIGAWISVPARYRTVVVPRRTAHAPGRVVVPLTLVVPGNASPGDHVGGIAVSLESQAATRTGQKYRLVQQVGSRVFLRVSGPLHPKLSVESLEASYLPPTGLGRGGARVSFVVHNTGNVSLGGRLGVTVSGLFGAHASAARPPAMPLLLPGSRLRLTTVVHGVWPTLVAKATVTVHPLAIEGAQVPAAGPWSATVSFLAVPWWPLGILLALLLLLGGALAWRRRVPARPATTVPTEPSAPRPEEVRT